MHRVRWRQLARRFVLRCRPHTHKRDARPSVGDVHRLAARWMERFGRLIAAFWQVVGTLRLDEAAQRSVHAHDCCTGSQGSWLLRGHSKAASVCNVLREHFQSTYSHHGRQQCVCILCMQVSKRTRAGRTMRRRACGAHAASARDPSHARTLPSVALGMVRRPARQSTCLATALRCPLPLRSRARRDAWKRTQTACVRCCSHWRCCSARTRPLSTGDGRPSPGCRRWHMQRAGVPAPTAAPA